MKFLKRLWYNFWHPRTPAVTPTTPEVEQPKPTEPEVQLPLPVEIPSENPEEIADFKFVDSSHHHPDFDPIKYKAAFINGGIPFLSNKCTQGTTFKDSTHIKRKKQCEENGIEYSGYHFYECRRDPIAQAKFYVDTHGTFKAPPQVDFETADKVQTEADLYADKEDLLKCLIEIERLTGRTPWLYVNYSAAFRLKFDKRFARFIAWFARYNSTLGAIPAPWTVETTGAWQYTESGVFAGFKGGNDVNIYYGKVNALKLK